MRDNKPIPTIIILFGATGDLMGRKIIPALFSLYKKSLLPRPLYFIGFARRDFSNEKYREYIKNIIKTGSEEEIRAFSNHFFYQRGDFNELNSYQTLSDTIHAISSHAKICAHKLFYLAVPPAYYDAIFENLHRSGSLLKCANGQGWMRVVVEKPFGNDSKTAQKLDQKLSTLFSEEQVYRIDHYLGKEMLQNILSFRFANNILEDSWNNRMVEKIEVKLWETLGVEDRIHFYDGVGALRDVGQNHLLQMLALVTMDNPKEIDAERIRSKRADMLSKIKKPSLTDIKDFIRAQYSTYKNIDSKNGMSKTETYFKIKLFIDSKRWQNVPIYLESGKKMKRNLKEISITFKPSDPCLCPPNNKVVSNKVIIQFEPKEKIVIQFLAKKPGFNYEVEPKNMQFNLKHRYYKNKYAGEYEKLLLDAINGDQTLFVSSKEVQEMWRVIDPIVDAWAKNIAPLHIYKPNSDAVSKKADQIIA